MNNFKKIQSYAIKTNNFVRLDMESSKITDLTFNIYKQLIVNINIQSTSRLNTLIGILPKSYDINIIKMINNFIPYKYSTDEIYQYIPFQKYH